MIHQKSTYQVEKAVVEQRDILGKIRDYVQGRAADDQLHEVEESLFRMLMTYGRSLLSEVINGHNQDKQERTATTPEGILPRHGSKSREYLSIFGLVNIERAYYWKSGALSGVCPLDSKLNLPAHKFSYLLLNWTQGRIVNDPYDEAIESIREILGLELHKQGQEQATKSSSSSVQQYYSERDVIDPATEGEVLIATSDCKGVPMVPSQRPDKPKQDGKIRRGRGDKKKGLRKDAVVTSDYSFNPQARTASDVIDGLMAVNGQKGSKAKDPNQSKATADKPREPKNKRVAASMFGKEVAFKELGDRLAKRDPTEKKKIFLLVDGERALEKGLLKEFHKRGWHDRIAGVGLDVVHTMEYLWDAGTALYGEKSPDREPWVRAKATAILEGRVGRVIGGLRQILTKRKKGLTESRRKAMRKAITYFENHRHMMRYDEYLAKGYPIATGVIEGACGCLVKNRTDSSGMKWTLDGVQAVLNLRAVRQNGNWEDFFSYHIEKEQERLYGRESSKAAV